MDAGFDQDEAEFRVFVFAIALEVFADGYGLWKVKDYVRDIDGMKARKMRDWRYRRVREDGRREKAIGNLQFHRVWGKESDAGGGLTFLINMYRSSGISGARPVGRKSLRQSETKQRHRYCRFVWPASRL